LKSQIEFLNLPFYDDESASPQSVEILKTAIQRASPTIIFMPDINDPHPTHKLGTALTLSALKELPLLCQKIKEVWFYETPWNEFSAEETNFCLRFSKELAIIKKRAIRAHRSQLSRLPFDQWALMRNQKLASFQFASRTFDWSKKTKLSFSYAEAFKRIWNLPI
jgi:LmbE family N-acetylglucosaminyl deacetylase